jgi:hypothetical protein
MRKAIIFLLFFLPFQSQAATYQQARASCDSYKAGLSPNSPYYSYRCGLFATSTKYVCLSNGSSNIACWSYTGAECPTGQYLDASSGQCIDLLACKTTPTLTTNGNTSIINWEVKTNSACVPNSISCTSPLTPNVEFKRCDLNCGDGNIIDPSISTCPPCNFSTMVRNPTTNICEDPHCEPPKYLNTVTHACADEPNCVGDQIIDTTAVPHACLDPRCDLPALLNLATHKCETPPKACDPGYTLNSQGVCEQIQCTAPKISCDIGGVRQCATPEQCGINPNPNPDPNPDPNPNPDPTPGTDTETATAKTPNNPGGSIGSFSAPALNNPGAGMGTSSESTPTQQGAGMGEFKSPLGSPDPELGKWYTPTEDTYSDVLSNSITNIQNQPIMNFGQSIFDVSIGSGSCSPITFPAVMGFEEMTADWICSDFMENFWPFIRAVVIGGAVVMAFRIAMDGLK